jgi:predicted ATPase
MHMHDPDRIAEEITRSVNFLTTSLRDMPERHRGIRAVFALWSLLTEPQQLALAQLSIFRGGFGLDAALAIAQATSQTIAALRSVS